MFNFNNHALNQDIVDAIASLDPRTVNRLPRSVRKQLNRLPSQHELKGMLPTRLFRRPRRRCLIGLLVLGLVAVAVAAFFFLRDDEDDFDFEIEL